MVDGHFCVESFGGVVLKKEFGNLGKMRFLWKKKWWIRNPVRKIRANQILERLKEDCPPYK